MKSGSLTYFFAVQDDPGRPVRTENVVARPDSVAKAFVGAGGVSPTDAGALIGYLMDGK
jgi:hypothetical protein